MVLRPEKIILGVSCCQDARESPKDGAKHTKDWPPRWHKIGGVGVGSVGVSPWVQDAAQSGTPFTPTPSQRLLEWLSKCFLWSGDVGLC